MPKYRSQMDYQQTLPQGCKVKWTRNGYAVEGPEALVVHLPDVVKVGKAWEDKKTRWVPYCRGYLRPGTIAVQSGFNRR